MTTAPEMTAARVDGRRERSADSRRKILAATMDLIEEGRPNPTAETISARAGVSLRTLFRHFEEMENLYLEIAALVMQRLRPLLSQHNEKKPWPHAMYQMIERRAAFFEALLPFKASLDVYRHRSAALAAQQEKLAKASRELLVADLPRDVASNVSLVQSLDLLLSAESWQRLRQQQKQSVKEAIVLLSHMCEAVMANAGKPITAN